MDQSPVPLRPDSSRAWRSRLRGQVRARPDRPWIVDIAIGATAALLAVGCRYLLPLQPHQLPTLTVVVTLAIVTTFVGVRAGIATAAVGGLLSWYFFFNPHSWSLANDAWIPLLGFAVIATVIISTAHLYRTTERRLHDEEIEKLEEQTANAQLFAREMAHRLKNALAIVQAIAFQTMTSETADPKKFAGRLKVLADANELLSEHVTRPMANVTEVIEAALKPFDDWRSRIDVTSVDADIPSQQVLSLALALHELATNAVKYGALSAPAGRVAITVEDAGDQLNLIWVESGGPEVTQPAQEGFGTRLLRRSSSDTRIAFDQGGLRCSFVVRKA